MKDIEIKHYSPSLSWASQALEEGYRVEVSNKEFYDGGYRSTRLYTYFIEYTNAPCRAAAIVIALKEVKQHTLTPYVVDQALAAVKREVDSQLSLSFDI